MKLSRERMLHNVSLFNNTRGSMGKKEGVELRQRTEEALSHEVLGLKMQARSYRETKKTKWTNEEESM